LTNYLNKKSLLFAAKQLSKKDDGLSAIFATDGVPPLPFTPAGFLELGISNLKKLGVTR